MNLFTSQSHRTLLSRPSTSTIASSLAVSQGAPRPAVVALDDPTPPASGLRSSLSTSQETQHPSSPRATTVNASATDQQQQTHIKAEAQPSTLVTMQVPEGFVPVVKAFKQAQLQLSEAEHALSQRAQQMLARLASATPSDASQVSEDADATEGLQGSDLVQHDLNVCASHINQLRTLSHVFSDTGARRMECELVDRDVAEFQASANAQFQNLIALTQRAVTDAQHHHSTNVQRSQRTFAEAKEAFCAHEQDLGQRMQSIARTSMEKLDAMHRRMSMIEQQKAVEAEEIKGRLSTRDRYDPETVTLHRASTQLTEHLGLVSSQLLRLEQLRSDMVDAMGGEAQMEDLVGRAWLANLAAHPKPLSPTESVQPTIPLPVAAVAGTSSRVPPSAATASDEAQRPAPAVLKRGRRDDEVLVAQQRPGENRGMPAAAATAAAAPSVAPPVRAQPQQATTDTVPQPQQQQQRSQPIRLTPLHAPHANTQPTPPSVMGQSDGTQRMGFMSFFRAVAARAMTFDDDVDIVEQAVSDDDASSSGSPVRQRRRTEITTSESPRQVAAPSTNEQAK